MNFVSLEELCEIFEIEKELEQPELLERIKERVRVYFIKESNLFWQGRDLSAQDVYFLLDLYEKRENRVFSGWVKADKNLFTFLGSGISQLKSGKIEPHSGHTLEKNYKSFASLFLKDRLNKSIQKSIRSQDLSEMAIEIDLSQLLENESKVTSQRAIANYFSDHLSGDIKDRRKWRFLTNREAIEVLNKLDDNYYSLKVKYVDWIKEMRDSRLIPVEKVTACLTNLQLSGAHKKEIDQFISSKASEDLYETPVNRFKSLLRNPLFYVGLIIVVVMIYVLAPKEKSEYKKAEGNLKNRSGLDSLTTAEVQEADTLLGYSEDTVKTNVEGVPTKKLSNSAFQVVDLDDSIKNQLASSLINSMFVDYTIQSDQNDSDDCDPLKNRDRQAFQMKGVNSVEDILLGEEHLFQNQSSYDLYIMLFKNDEKGKVYGSYIPSNGKLSFRYQKEMRLVIYSGNQLTRFNPLMHKNGGYGSLDKARKIDERLIAHFCLFDKINEALLNHNWSARGKGKTTILKETAFDLQLESQVFQR